METETMERNGVSWVETLAAGGQLAREQDALDLVAGCGEAGTHRLLLSAGSLAEAFYDLRSGLAGAALLKFSNYRLTVAAVIPDEIAQAGRFGEFVLETNRGRAFRVFNTLEAARDWLAQSA